MTFGNKVIIAMDLTDFVKPGALANEIQLGTGATLLASEVCGISMVCRSAAINRVVRVKPAISQDLSVLGETAKLSGIALIVERDTTPETIETYLSIDTRRDYSFDFFANPTPTIAQITANLVQQINNIDPMDSWSVQRPFTAIVDPADSEWMIISGNRKGLFNVYATWHGVLSGYEILQAGSNGSLTDKEVRQMFPSFIGFVPGQDVAAEWMGCKSPCIIYIDVFIESKKTNQYNNMQNALPNYAADVVARYEIWVNRADPQYANFLSQLQSLTGKTLTINTPTNLDIRAGRDITVTPFIDGNTCLFIAEVKSTSTIINDSEIDFDETATLVNPSMTSKVLGLSNATEGNYFDPNVSLGKNYVTVSYTVNKSGIITKGTLTIPVTIPN